MIQNVMVLGAGSAGLLAALTLKRKLPQLAVHIVRSPDIGVIGVGEGTTPFVPAHLFEYLGISPRRFYQMAEPTWKIGIRLLWGPRPFVDYALLPQLDSRWLDLPRTNGFYCDEEFSGVNLPAALMVSGKAFVRQGPAGGPDLQPWFGFHIENKKFVDTLEVLAREAGVAITDGRVSGAERGPAGVAAIILEDGQRLAADFFIDASGFRSELLGRTLGEPYLNFERTLFCDRAVVGGWERTTEPILPYTTAETMDAGWAWQIEHEHHVNRGYVYSSAFISDDDARAEFLRKNPKAPQSARVVKFRSGRQQRTWVDNVVGIGNAAGFVEPLEATALMVVCGSCQSIVECLQQCGLEPTPTIRQLFNDVAGASWDDIRDFLGLHYKFNTRLETPFWRHCREHTDISGVAPLLEFYAENGPAGLGRHRLKNTVQFGLDSAFGIEGFLVILVGMRVPYRGRHKPPPAERQIWERHRAQLAAQAQNSGLTVRECLASIRHPSWRWRGEV